MAVTTTATATVLSVHVCGSIVVFRRTLADMCRPTPAETVPAASALADLLAKQLQGSGKKGSSDGASTPSSTVQMHGGATMLGSHQAMSDPTKMRELEDKIETLTAKLAKAEMALAAANAAQAKEEAARIAAEGREQLLQTRLGDSEKQVVKLQANLDEAHKSRANEGDLRHQNALWSSLLMAQMNVDETKFGKLMAASRQAGSSSDDKGASSHEQ